MSFDPKTHWDNIYGNKTPQQVSWTENMPTLSLELIAQLPLQKTDSIIDIGGGESTLAANLLEQGYQDISVLDISADAIEKAKANMGANANRVNWIVSDMLAFTPQKQYTLWHDRAAFHFLIEPAQQTIYLNAVRQVNPKYLIIGTFADNGPEKCSGLPVQRYNEHLLAQKFPGFELLQRIRHQHKTPFDTLQNFIFCTFGSIPA